jgi:hypothetical protein
VQRALSALLKGRTVLVIAHRLATVKHADRVVVIHGGRIAEMGGHRELIASVGGIYRGLAALQQFRRGPRLIRRPARCYHDGREERLMSLRQLIQRPIPVTAPLVLNPLMTRMAEAAGFPAGYLGRGSTGYQKVALEANLNVTEMCQIAVDIGAVSSLPLILDGACGYGDPMHMHRTISMSEAAGFQAIEIEDQLVPKRAHHHAGVEHMIPMELMAAKVKEAVAARRNPDFPDRRADERDPGEQHGRRAPPRRRLPGRPAPTSCSCRWRTSPKSCERSRSGWAAR